MVQEMAQETMNGTGNLDDSGGHEWYRKPWMVQKTLDGSGDHKRYRRWLRKP